LALADGDLKPITLLDWGAHYSIDNNDAWLAVVFGAHCISFVARHPNLAIMQHWKSKYMERNVTSIGVTFPITYSSASEDPNHGMAVYFRREIGVARTTEYGRIDVTTGSTKRTVDQSTAYLDIVRRSSGMMGELATQYKTIRHVLPKRPKNESRIVVERRQVSHLVSQYPPVI
jgi:hypothetical protein